MAKILELFRDYSRIEVHDILDPDSSFTRGSGVWGLQGIIPLPQRAGDFALFVAYGRSQGEHNFDEGISEDGILRWQSQPKQTLNDKTIKKLISHDEAENVIHLFLRTKIRHGGEQMPYTYLGRLKYRGHDSEREQPVHFLWQLLDWPIPDDVRQRMNLLLDGANSTLAPGPRMPVVAPNTLLATDPPKQKSHDPQPTKKFQAVQRRYPSEAENRKLGNAGEQLVVEYEIQELTKLGRHDLATQVTHVSVLEGDGAGYDIRSFFEDGTPKFIEVKTTTGPKTADFLISANEVAFSQANPEAYELRRLYDYDAKTKSAKFYSIFGNLIDQFSMKATEYRVARLTDE